MEAPIEKQIELHYKDNFSSLVKRIKYRTGTTQAAEDVVQEAYLRALKYKGAFIEGANMEHWFSRILSNALKDYMRAEREYSGMDDIEDEEGEPVENENIPDSIKREIRFAISQLPDHHREVVELYYIYGYELRQIAQIVDMKYQTINQTIQRFKNALKERYV